MSSTLATVETKNSLVNWKKPPAAPDSINHKSGSLNSKRSKGGNQLGVICMHSHNISCIKAVVPVEIFVISLQPSALRWFSPVLLSTI